MDISYLKGVGPSRARALRQMGINTVEELLEYAPYKYRDLSVELKADDELPPCGSYCLVRGRPQQLKRAYHGKKCIVTTRLADSRIRVVWFNMPYIAGTLNDGEEYLFYGKISTVKNAISIINPMYERASSPQRLKGIIPVYRVKGVSSVFCWECVKQALDLDLPMYDVLCDITGQDVGDYLRSLHTPGTMAEAVSAMDRYKLSRSVSVLAAYRINSGDKLCNRLYNYSHLTYQEHLNKLPYTLTLSQLAALDEIATDLSCERTMNRILAGDVGSGKSIVAYLAMSMAVSSGYSAAIMAPTEILAMQHYDNLVRLFGSESVTLITSSTAGQGAPAAKRAAYLVGTHSLISSDLYADNLSMVVIDEQHRFGVRQRSALENRGHTDTLVLSATPIPRTMMLALTGVLDQSKLDMPKGRQAVNTYLISAEKVNKMYDFIASSVRSGKKAFVVCPAIYDEDGVEISSIESLYRQLYPIFKDDMVTMHGRMSEADKRERILSFVNGDRHVMLSTTVVEVGIDVKGANIMVIVNAERYGLATLHQLRGRVGRDGEGGYCFLLTGDGVSTTATEKIRAFTKMRDGEQIAMYDLGNRGAGDIMGLTQSGKESGYFDARRLAEAADYTDKLLSEPALLNNYTKNTAYRYIDLIDGVTLD